jgi:hypothetical protein
MSIPKQDERTPVYTEGVCGDGAMILRDGQPFPIPSIIDALNAYTSTEALREALANALRALEFSRAELNEYELEATGEDYNSPTINAAIDEARTALSGRPAPSTPSLGYLYFNPDTGTEFPENHPVESGECDDAENVREATAEALRDELVEAWRANAEMEVNHARAIKQISGSPAPSTVQACRVCHGEGCVDDDPEVRGSVTECWKCGGSGVGSPAPSTEGLREWLRIAGAPRDQNIIVAAMNTYSKTWIVGEARWEYDNRGDGDWWWANTCPGDYAADSIFNMNGAVEFWQPLPPAPDAARTALAGVTAPQEVEGK